jgi:hypothetical protein
MNPHTSILDAANTVSVAKLIQLHLVPPFEPLEENGVTISVVPTWNRSGVPRTAQTWRFTFKGSDWEMVVRAVFHEGKLLEPLAPHCVVELYDGGTTDTACTSANTWLRQLDL